MNKTTICLFMCFVLRTVFAHSQSEVETGGEREYYDSAHFHVIKGKYITGELFLECYENKNSKLDSWKEYYKNGKVKNEGSMTTGNHIYVGIWKYYSPNGKVDSIVNYDKKQPISYFKALKIAASKKFIIPNIEVTETTYENRNYWQITRWIENKDHSGQTGEFIYIDKITGKTVSSKNVKLIGFY
jgi:antitoxin component YwqK of YwqJK toxin-antitoxin module